MVAEKQPALNAETLAAWASERSLSLTLFHGWNSFIEQTLFWADIPKQDGARQAAAFIHERLQSVEASPEAVALWDKLSSA